MKTKYLVLCGLFAALMAVCSWIAVPIGSVTYTLQTFAVFLALMTLGGKWGSLSIFVYLCLGMVGLPVFSGFQGGFGAMFQATGGYLWGFLGCGLCFWVVTSLFGSRKRAMFAGSVAGLTICYLCGTCWMVYFYLGGENLGAMLFAGTVPYLLPDAVKLSLAFLVSRRLKKLVPLAK